MNTMTLDTHSLRTQAEQALKMAREDGAYWAQKELLRWHRAIRHSAARGYKACESANLRPVLRGAFESIIGPTRNPEFLAGYVDELQRKLGDDFTVKNHSFQDSEGNLWWIVVTW